VFIRGDNALNFLLLGARLRQIHFPGSWSHFAADKSGKNVATDEHG